MIDLQSRMDSLSNNMASTPSKQSPNGSPIMGKPAIDSLARSFKRVCLQSSLSAAAPLKHGPRSQGLGCENEEQAIVATDTMVCGSLVMRVTLLAAGFIIGPSGITIRELQSSTATEIGSRYTDPDCMCSRPTRTFTIKGQSDKVREAFAIICKAVDRYKELCEGKYKGIIVRQEQDIQGVRFLYQPPPRRIVPDAAILASDSVVQSLSTGTSSKERPSNNPYTCTPKSTSKGQGTCTPGSTVRHESMMHSYRTPPPAKHHQQLHQHQEPAMFVLTPSPQHSVGGCFHTPHQQSYAITATSEQDIIANHLHQQRILQRALFSMQPNTTTSTPTSGVESNLFLVSVPSTPGSLSTASSMDLSSYSPFSTPNSHQQLSGSTYPFANSTHNNVVGGHQLLFAQPFTQLHPQQLSMVPAASMPPGFQQHCPSPIHCTNTVHQAYAATVPKINSLFELPELIDTDILESLKSLHTMGEDPFGTSLSCDEEEAWRSCSRSSTPSGLTSSLLAELLEYE